MNATHGRNSPRSPRHQRKAFTPFRKLWTCCVTGTTKTEDLRDVYDAAASGQSPAGLTCEPDRTASSSAVGNVASTATQSMPYVLMPSRNQLPTPQRQLGASIVTASSADRKPSSPVAHSKAVSKAAGSHMDVLSGDDDQQSHGYRSSTSSHMFNLQHHVTSPGAAGNDEHIMATTTQATGDQSAVLPHVQLPGPVVLPSVQELYPSPVQQDLLQLQHQSTDRQPDRRPEHGLCLQQQQQQQQHPVPAPFFATGHSTTQHVAHPTQQDTHSTEQHSSHAANAPSSHSDEQRSRRYVALPSQGHHLLEPVEESPRQPHVSLADGLAGEEDMLLHTWIAMQHGQQQPVSAQQTVAGEKTAAAAVAAGDSEQHPACDSDRLPTDRPGTSRDADTVTTVRTPAETQARDPIAAGICSQQPSTAVVIAAANPVLPAARMLTPFSQAELQMRITQQLQSGIMGAPATAVQSSSSGGRPDACTTQPGRSVTGLQGQQQHQNQQQQQVVLETGVSDTGSRGVGCSGSIAHHQQQQHKVRVPLPAEVEEAVITQIRTARASSLAAGADPARVWALVDTSSCGAHTTVDASRRTSTVHTRSRADQADGGGATTLTASTPARFAVTDAVADGDAAAPAAEIEDAQQGDAASPAVPPQVTQALQQHTVAPPLAATPAAADSTSPQQQLQPGSPTPQQPEITFQQAEAAVSSDLGSPDVPQGLRKIKVGKGKAPIAAAVEHSGSHILDNSSSTSAVDTGQQQQQQQQLVVVPCAKVGAAFGPRHLPGGSAAVGDLGAQQDSWNGQVWGSANSSSSLNSSSRYYTAVGAAGAEYKTVAELSNSDTAAGGIHEHSALSAGFMEGAVGGSGFSGVRKSRSQQGLALSGSQVEPEDSWGPFMRIQQQQQAGSTGAHAEAVRGWEVLPVVPLSPLRVPSSRRGLGYDLDGTPATPRTSVVGVSNSIIDHMLSEEGIPLVPTSALTDDVMMSHQGDTPRIRSFDSPMQPSWRSQRLQQERCCPATPRFRHTNSFSDVQGLNAGLSSGSFSRGHLSGRAGPPGLKKVRRMSASEHKLVQSSKGSQSMTGRTSAGGRSVFNDVSRPSTAAAAVDASAGGGCGGGGVTGVGGVFDMSAFEGGCPTPRHAAHKTHSSNWMTSGPAVLVTTPMELTGMVVGHQSMSSNSCSTERVSGGGSVGRAGGGGEWLSSASNLASGSALFSRSGLATLQGHQDVAHHQQQQHDKMANVSWL